jgi:hypothetical protein
MLIKLSIFMQKKSCMKRFFCSLLLFLPLLLDAQTNIISVNPLAEQIMLGNYDPALYAPAQTIPDDPATLGQAIEAGISADRLKSKLIRLSEFGTRNTGSDTVSGVTGIGAARRWVYDELRGISTANNGRLVVSYLQFDQNICGMGQHRNVFAVLPGSDPQNNGVILVEGHLDSRCDVLCDVSCPAAGIEDNATGTALVMELAQVMAPYQFKNTVVFVLTIGEEQGLSGADAFALYIQQKNIPLRAVLNNDVIGGIICGQTSSPPSCSGLNAIDSTSVRLFSAGNFNSKSKQLARFIKLQYKENVLPSTVVPMNVRIMSPEDRTGRGGDHIPFREKGYPAMRFTSANEHGDASNGPNYTDRQHTSDDVLGVDTDNDNIVDSFFVDFNYLARNTTINGNALAVAARGVPVPPDFTATRFGSLMTITFTGGQVGTDVVRVAIRTTTNDWDTVYQVNAAPVLQLPCNPTGPVIVSTAGVDSWGAESLFSIEKLVATTGTAELANVEEKNIRLFQNRPNPFDEATWISFFIQQLPIYQEANVMISDMQGRVLENIPVILQQGMNEVLYTHGYGGKGAFVYSLQIDKKTIDSRQMIFAN